MAKIIKCCINHNCSVYHKKSAYLDDDKYCIKCGQELYHVCKGKDTDEGKPCFTVLDNGKQKYCLRCETVIEQRKEETAQKAKDIGGKVVAVAAMAAPVAQKGGDVAKKVGAAAAKIIIKK